MDEIKAESVENAKTADAHKDCFTSEVAGVLWLLRYPPFLK